MKNSTSFLDRNRTKSFCDGVKTIKHFLDDIELLCDGNQEKIDYVFYFDNYEQLLFYISKTLLNDNYDVIFDKLDTEAIEAYFDGETYLNPNIETYHPVSIYLSRHQFCDIPNKYRQDLKTAYKEAIRKPICHYDFLIDGDKIHTNIKKNEQECILSIGLIMGLLRDTLGSRGMSTKEGAYEYLPLIKHNCFLEIQNKSKNKQTPSEIVRNLPKEIYNSAASVSSIRGKIQELCDQFGNYYIRKEDFNPLIMQKIGLSKIDTIGDAMLYLCSRDDSYRGGIAYNLLTDLVFRLRDKQGFSNNYIHKYCAILKNTAFISYMSLVFDDLFSRNFSGLLDSSYFTEGPYFREGQKPNVAWKFRNSLAHSRYLFEDYFDSSDNIVIEFWDEAENVKNFECKITKSSANALINDYLRQLSITS